MKTYEPTQLRWQRRYGGRRWILGSPVPTEPTGLMLDDMVALDIAQRRVWHALRPTMLGITRTVARVLDR